MTKLNKNRVRKPHTTGPGHDTSPWLVAVLIAASLLATPRTAKSETCEIVQTPVETHAAVNSNGLRYGTGFQAAVAKLTPTCTGRLFVQASRSVCQSAYQTASWVSTNMNNICSGFAETSEAMTSDCGSLTRVIHAGRYAFVTNEEVPVGKTCTFYVNKLVTTQNRSTTNYTGRISIQNGLAGYWE